MPNRLDRGNNFGLLRLILASMVIISHSAELIDGNRQREILYRATGNVTLGGIAVYGFFLVSGYLITKSFITQKNVYIYAMKRLSRIIPGYIVCFCICAFFIAPFVGAGSAPFHPRELLRLSAEALRLLAPDVPGTFIELPYSTLNGSMWTIAYEMRCYLATVILGIIGLYSFRGKHVFLFLIATSLIIANSGVMSATSWCGQPVFGRLDYNLELMSIFGSGALFFLFEERVFYKGLYALAAAVLLYVSLMIRVTETGVAIFGGYLVFWFALKCRVFTISLITNRTDVSYGVYLYAFPLQNLIIYCTGISNPWLLTLISLPASLIAGFLSWTIIERPALRLARRWIKQRNFDSKVPTTLPQRQQL